MVAVVHGRARIGSNAMCGWVLARAHAKAGDSALIAGYLGSSDQFNNHLATERDYKAFHRAIRSGRAFRESQKMTRARSF